MYWTTGSGRIESQITKKQAAACHHPGPCDSDVQALQNIPSIKRQLAKIPADVLASELKEYGAWDETELQDHAANLTRILWIACGDISDGRN